MRLKYNHYTAVGGREINEDSLFAEEKNNAYLFAVADGLGGEGNGGTSKIDIWNMEIKL